MKTVKLCIFVLLLLLGLSITAQSIPAELRIVPEEALWVIHFDIGQFAAIPHFNETLRPFIESRQNPFGVNLLKDLRSVTLFGIGQDKLNTVICWNGSLNQEHLLDLLGKNSSHRQIKYKKHTIHQWNRSEYGVFVNDRITLQGKSELAIQWVLDVIDGRRKSVQVSKLLSAWKEIPQKAILKAASDNLSTLADGKDASMILKRVGLAVFLVLEDSGNLKMKLTLETDTPENAQNIQQLIQGFIALFKMKKADQEHIMFESMNLWEKLKMNVAGNRLCAEINYPSEKIGQIMDQFAFFLLGVRREMGTMGIKK